MKDNEKSMAWRPMTWKPIEKERPLEGMLPYYPILVTKRDVGECPDIALMIVTKDALGEHHLCYLKDMEYVYIGPGYWNNYELLAWMPCPFPYDPDPDGPNGRDPLGDMLTELESSTPEHT